MDKQLQVIKSVMMTGLDTLFDAYPHLSSLKGEVLAEVEAGFGAKSSGTFGALARTLILFAESSGNAGAFVLSGLAQATSLFLKTDEAELAATEALVKSTHAEFKAEMEAAQDAAVTTAKGTKVIQ